MFTSSVSLVVALWFVASPDVFAKRPVQLPGCPIVSFWSGAKAPAYGQQKAIEGSWVTHADNDRRAIRTRLLSDLAKDWDMTAKALRAEVCGDTGTACKSTLVMGDSDDGFATNYHLVIVAPGATSKAPRLFVHDHVCKDWETERAGTYCAAEPWGSDLVTVRYGAMASGDDDDGEDSLIWQQIYDQRSGALLLTSEAMDSHKEATRITWDAAKQQVTLAGCGTWSAAQLRTRQAPNGVKGSSKAVSAQIQAGRKATKAGDYAAAVKAFSAAIEADTAALKAWSGRGYAHLKAGRPAQALADFRHLLKVHGAAMDARFTKQVKHNIVLAEKALAAGSK